MLGEEKIFVAVQGGRSCRTWCTRGKVSGSPTDYDIRLFDPHTDLTTPPSMLRSLGRSWTYLLHIGDSKLLVEDVSRLSF